MLPSKLLISLKSAEELRSVADFSFSWIDLKDPSAGSIGCPPKNVVSDFLDSANGFLDRTRCHMSLALGELLDESWREIHPLASDFDFVKVALAGCADQCDWTDRIESLASDLRARQRLILVHYADHRLANAPSWHATLDAARLLDCKFVLIDTYDKSAGRLWDWYSPENIRVMAADAKRSGVQLSIAGSLKIDELPMARTLGASVIGVRGAACQDSSRVDGLCRDRLQRLSEIFSNQAVTS
jgi:uncharacterized protein (UPF0264 family)